VLRRVWWEGSRIIGELNPDLPEDHSGAAWVAAPRLIELCFQTAGLGGLRERRLGLPLHIDRVRYWRDWKQMSGPIYAVVSPAESGGGWNAEVVDDTGRRYVSLAGYRTVDLPDLIQVPAMPALEAVTA